MVSTMHIYWLINCFKHPAQLKTGYLPANYTFFTRNLQQPWGLKYFQQKCMTKQRVKILKMTKSHTERPIANQLETQFIEFTLAN